jgi:predicted aspartyl protease
MFVNVLINGMQTKFLIDTGTTVSMLSRRLYDKLKDQSCYEIQKTKMKVFTADGTQMKLQGKLDVQVKLGTKEIGISALISDIQPDGILGLDIIRNHDTMISAKDETLTINGEVVPIMFEGALGCFRITAREKCTFPHRKERVGPGKLSTQDRVDVPKEGIVEMAKHITSCSKALIYCDHCDFRSLKSRNIKRHMKRKHDLVIDRGQASGGVKNGDQGNGDSAEESWLGQDPRTLIEVFPAEVEERKKEEVDHEPGSSIRSSLKEDAGKGLEIGRVVRKPAQPLSKQKPARKFGTAPLPDKSTSTDILPDMFKTNRDIQCQIDPVLKTVSSYQ